jgi:hypothetical protein
MSRRRHRSGSTEGRVIYSSFKLCGFEWRSDLIAHDYMRRWTLFTPWGMLRLHHILRGDDRAHFHDHPMDFVSLILKGGYVEHRPDHPPRAFHPGDVVAHRAEDMHALEMLNGTAWTLVVAGHARRQWGFATEDGWIVSGEYDAWKTLKHAGEQKDES